MKNIGALILAAGAPAQPGHYKPLLCIGESTILRYSIEMMRSAGADRILIVTGYLRELIEKHVADMGVEFLYNPDYDKTHMYDSVKMGLGALEESCRRILLSHADVPLVRPKTVRRMLDEKRADVVIPVCGSKEGHPILIRSSIVPDLLKLNPDKGLSEAIHSRGFKVKSVEVDDEGVVFNAEIPKDYMRLLRRNAALGENETARPRLEMELRIAGEEPLLDSTTALFLKLIRLTGSMQMACSCVHISYSKGWKAVNHIEKQLGTRILRRTRGGSEGGGSQLTAEGEELLRRFEGMKEEVGLRSREIFDAWFGDFPA
jgi:molybdate transport repressor ModE-like protein